MSLIARIDEDLCLAHGDCEAVAPEAFRVDDVARVVGETTDDRLREAARRQTRYMALHGVWGHNLAGCDPFTWMESAGYRGTSMGQNLGRRQGRNSARLAVSSWIASRKGHCEALMDPRWKALGVAYVRSGSIHLWTVDFGNR